MTANPFQNPPSGLVGELAQYIYASANRPVAEIAIAGAITYMAGVTGRAYNVSGTGLNQYVLLIAGTGTGKEAARRGVTKFISYAKSNVWHTGDIPNSIPTVDEHTGPADIASGQALIKYISSSRSFSAFVGEFGHTIQRICHPRASSSDVMLRKVLLDLYNQSGEHDVLQPTIYSDKANNTDPVDSPAFSLFGETSPEGLYPHLDESMIAMGLLPRFLPIIYEGQRVPSNLNAQEAVPTPEMVKRFANLVSHTASLNAQNTVINVKTAPDANEFIGMCGTVDKLADKKINKGQSSVASELWNRAHIKAWKLAALIAVGKDHNNPVISLADAEWSFAVVRHGIETLSKKFDMGVVGTEGKSEKAQQQKLREVLQEWVTRPWSQLERYGAGTKVLHEKGIIPWSYLSKRLTGVAAFRKAPMGATNALKRAMDNLVACGEYCKIPQQQLPTRTNTQGTFYVPGDENEVFKGGVKFFDD